MITVKAPEVYWNKPGILEEGAAKIASIGKHALIIGGKTALGVIEAPLISRLKSEGVAYDIAEFQGHCTPEEIQEFAEIAAAKQADLIIGAGGGKALDLAKAVGDQLYLPVVTIPTVPATCAAWSALTVRYDDQGRSFDYLPLKKSPVLVLADTQILAAAPKRFLAAGIGDSWVKWYEVGVNIRDEGDELDVKIATQTAKLALDILERHAPEAYEKAGTGEVTEAFSQTVDAVILLAGLVGSVAGHTARSAISHSIHNSLTHILETHGTLHGEIVAFSLLTQAVLEGRAEEEIEQLAGSLRRFNLPVTLKELGIIRNSEAVAEETAQGVKFRPEAIVRLPFSTSKEAIVQAIIEADRAGQRAV